MDFPLVCSALSRVVYLSPGWRRDLVFRFKNSPKEYTAFFHLHTFREDLLGNLCW
jgi:hypothetical protein